MPFIGQVFIRHNPYDNLVDVPSGVQGRGRKYTKPSRGRVMDPLMVEASLRAHKVKNLPAVQKTQVLPLGQEDPLDEEMLTHSSIS